MSTLPDQIPPALMQQFLAQWKGGGGAPAPSQGTATPKCSGLQQRVLDEVSDARATIAEVVRESNQSTEQYTLRIGQDLNEIVSTANAYADDLQQRFGTLQASKDSSGIVEAITAQTTTTREFIDGVRTSTSDQKKVAEAALERAENIMRIGTAINEVARNSKMLALNASIEAARLGVPGRSFAVIASEMQTLSERVHESNTLVRDLVEGMMELLPQVLEGASSMANDTDTFRSRFQSDTRTLRAETTKLQEVLKDVADHQDDRIAHIMSTSQDALSNLQFQDPMAQRLMRIDRRLETMQHRLSAWFDNRELTVEVQEAMQVELGGGYEHEDAPESGELLLF